MARTLRLQFPGAIYHVTFRGNERRIIFRQDADRQRFLDQLAESRDLFQVRLFLVCLMSNHVHLLLETPCGNLAAFMGRLLTAYAVYFNRHYRRAGHLTQGRYHAKMVEGDAYLLKLSRYVHLNPVCGKPWQGIAASDRIKALRAYRWSTYRGYVGLEKSWPGIDEEPLLAMLQTNGESSCERYQKYVEAGLIDNDEGFPRVYRQSRLALGSAKFIDGVRQRYDQLLRGTRRPEDAALRRIGRLRSPEAVLPVVAQVLKVRLEMFHARRRNSLLRAAAIWALSRHADLNQRQIAKILMMNTGAAVSHQLARWRNAVNTSPRWQALQTEMDRLLTLSDNY